MKWSCDTVRRQSERIAAGCVYCSHGGEGDYVLRGGLMEVGGAGMEFTGKGRRFVGGWVQGVAGTLFVGKSAERKLLFV